MSLAALAACSDMDRAPTAGSSCANDVRQFQSSGGLGVQGGTPRQQALRSGAQMYVQQAAEAASRGDEATCRRNLDQARLSLTY